MALPISSPTIPGASLPTSKALFLSSNCSASGSPPNRHGTSPLLYSLASLTPHSWLVAKGRHDEAKAILAKYHAGGDLSSPLVAFELAEMEGSIRTEQTITSETSYLDLVRTAPNRRRTIIAMIIGFYGTWSGIAIIAYYLTLVLNTIGITSTHDQVLINGLTQVFNLVVSVTSALLVDRIGRRTLWLVAIAGMMCSYIAWTALSATFARSKDPAIGRSVLAFIFLYKLFYNGSFSPMLLAYPIEIFPYTLRGRGLTISMATNQLALIVSQFVNPIALTKIEWRYYIVFCVLLAVFLVLAYFLFPETKGRSLEEIAEVFDGERIRVGKLDEERDEEDAADEKKTEVREEVVR
jgi:hypothetical protein